MRKIKSLARIDSISFKLITHLSFL
ncbi:hypothetical protein MNBD_GAMMA08-2451, partial [hydrothermal vent metagenome]